MSYTSNTGFLHPFPFTGLTSGTILEVLFTTQYTCLRPNIIGNTIVNLGCCCPWQKHWVDCAALWPNMRMACYRFSSGSVGRNKNATKHSPQRQRIAAQHLSSAQSDILSPFRLLCKSKHRQFAREHQRRYSAQ